MFAKKKTLIISFYVQTNCFDDGNVNDMKTVVNENIELFNGSQFLAGIVDEEEAAAVEVKGLLL